MPSLPPAPVGAQPSLGAPATLVNFRPWLTAVAVLVAAFGWPLYLLVRFSLKHESHSHILLVPMVSLYLAWGKRHTLPRSVGPARGPAVAAALAGVAILGAFAARQALGSGPLATADRLAFTTAAFVAGFVAVSAWFLGAAALRATLFSFGFLIFMIPMPEWLTSGFETFLQHGSAAAAYVMFKIVGTPVFRQELVFQLPGMFIEVAPECSGIRSTIALFITSIVAGYLFLRSPWTRVTLAAAVIPLALLRNGFRVFTIGELCVHISPDMIDSFIHHHGGPIFFALSLVPFAVLLRLLMKWESRRSRVPAR